MQQVELGLNSASAIGDWASRSHCFLISKMGMSQHTLMLPGSKQNAYLVVCYALLTLTCDSLSLRLSWLHQDTARPGAHLVWYSFPPRGLLWPPEPSATRCWTHHCIPRHFSFPTLLSQLSVSVSAFYFLNLTVISLRRETSVFFLMSYFSILAQHFFVHSTC